MPESLSNPRRTSRAKSCTRCRQSKVACDARRTLAGPCSRCRAQNVDCRFDANFKRVSTRKLTEQISQELHALRSADQIIPLKNITLDLGSSSKLTEDIGSISPKLSISETSLRGQTLLWPSIISSDIARCYSLGKFELESQIVVELFQHFGEQYRPYTMFLQPCTSLADLLSRSPLLFWTIILVASQDHARYMLVYQELLATHDEQLLSPILQRSIQQVETIHALLLLCLWPVPQFRYFDNPAWNYVGLAISAAMQLNCHNPSGSSSGSNGWNGLGDMAASELSTIDRSRTWLGCFWVGSEIASSYGLPPPLSTQQQLRSIDSALDTASQSIPAWFGALFSIIKVKNLVTESLGDVEDHALHFTLTQMFDDQLDAVKGANAYLWRPELEIEWCNAKLCLYALTFTTSTDADRSIGSHIPSHHQTILHKAREAASSLVTKLTKFSQQCTSGLYPSGLLTFAPKSYFAALFNAAAFLFRFMATCNMRTRMFAQENSAMDSIIEAHKILQSFPERRELTRAAIHTEMFIDMLRNSAGINMNELFVSNKLGASVMFDAVFRACRQRNTDPRDGKLLPIREWKTVNEIFAQRLPDAPAQSTADDHGGITGVPSDKDNGLEDFEQSAAVDGQAPQWWKEWDDYMDLFQVGVEQWEHTHMQTSLSGGGELGEPGDFVYA